MQPIPRRSTESSVTFRYAAAAKAPEAALCCAVEYNRELLKVIPQEAIDKDYGCGDPSQYVQPGETVLDLGSGTGKICFIAAQVVGPQGRVIGVDMTDDMLEVARRNAPIVAGRLGYTNVEFRKGRIQDLSLNLEILDQASRSSLPRSMEDKSAMALPLLCGLPLRWRRKSRGMTVIDQKNQRKIPLAHPMSLSHRILDGMSRQ